MDTRSPAQIIGNAFLTTVCQPQAVMENAFKTGHFAGYYGVKFIAASTGGLIGGGREIMFRIRCNEPISSRRSLRDYIITGTKEGAECSEIPANIIALATGTVAAVKSSLMVIPLTHSIKGPAMLVTSLIAAEDYLRGSSGIRYVLNKCKQITDPYTWLNWTAGKGTGDQTGTRELSRIPPPDAFRNNPLSFIRGETLPFNLIFSGLGEYQIRFMGLELRLLSAEHIFNADKTLDYIGMRLVIPTLQGQNIIQLACLLVTDDHCTLFRTKPLKKFITLIENGRDNDNERTRQGKLSYSYDVGSGIRFRVDLIPSGTNQYHVLSNHYSGQKENITPPVTKVTNE